MIIDVLSVLFMGFVSYCLFLAVVKPEIEKKRQHLKKLEDYYNNLQKK